MAMRERRALRGPVMAPYGISTLICDDEDAGRTGTFATYRAKHMLRRRPITHASQDGRGARLRGRVLGCCSPKQLSE